MVRTVSKAEKTRELIIEKTSAIFNMKGYAGTSLTDITEVTGLTKGSIYGNFENKDEVAIEAFKYNLKTMENLFGVEIAKRETYRSKILAYPDTLRKYSDEVLPKGGCPILNTAIESDDTHPVLKQLAQNALLTWRDKIINFINGGIRAGEFKIDLYPEHVAISIIAMIEGATMIRKLTGNHDYMQFAMKSLRDFINQL